MGHHHGIGSTQTKGRSPERVKRARRRYPSVVSTLPWSVRHPVAAVMGCVILPNVAGSVANILINAIVVEPALAARDVERFHRAILVYNAIVYPIALGGFLLHILPALRAMGAMARGEEPSDVLATRRRIANLPIVSTAWVAAGWLPVAVVFPIVLGRAALLAPFALSTLVSCVIAVTQSFFALDLLATRLYFPIVFRGSRVSDHPDVRRISIQLRSLFVYLATSLFPIASVLAIATSTGRLAPLWYVGGISALFGLALAWMMSRSLLDPISRLREATVCVRGGAFTGEVPVLRSDEIGILAEGFNEMMAGLEERERIRDVFGRSVGRHVATELLRQKHQLGGEVREVTVMFLDIRDFTPLSARLSATEVVTLLNRVFGPMIEAVWAEQGEVLTFLGDGFVAVFGAPLSVPDHAERALRAAQRVLAECDKEIRIGIGLHTGPVVAGSVGTLERKQYTVIGEVVNIASRLESHTKVAGRPIILSGETARRLPPGTPLDALGPAQLKGLDHPIEVHSIRRLDHSTEGR